jgi:exonuclease SbcD
VATAGDTPTIRVVARGPSRLALDLPGGRLSVAALPYPSEARIRTFVAPDLGDEVDAQRRYSAHVGEALASLCAAADGTVVALSHLHVRGAVLGDSERTLIGGAWQVDPEDLPPAAHYVALGHVHRTQQVAPNAWYAGAPLALRMDEREIAHNHLIVTPGAGAPAVEQVPVRAGRRLVRLELPDVDAAAQHVDALGDSFVEIVVPVPPSAESLIRLRRLPIALVRVRVSGVEGLPTRPEERAVLPAADLFRAWVRSQRGSDPDEALVSLFLELVDAPEGET